jgi:hypothetical protein
MSKDISDKYMAFIMRAKIGIFTTNGLRASNPMKVLYFM